MSDFKLAVDESNKATELPLLRVCGTVRQNPHMRAFWGATISFFLAFLGWFALAPLGLEVATSMGTCENQLYPPESTVASTIFVRIALGTLLERFGPVNVQSGLLTFGAIWVALAATIQAPWQYTVIRFFIGCAGHARVNVKYVGVP
eukprot:Skav225357  [mRNA]  locus=scaffold652:37888:38552:+ [translate_table: standard]